MKRVLIKNGVEIIEQTELTDFYTKNKKAIAAVTNKGNFEADEFVLATGAWTPFFNKILGVKIPIQPGKGYSVIIKPPKQCPTVPLLLKDKKMLASPYQDEYRISGTMEFSGYNEDINKKRIDAMIDGHKQYFPSVKFKEIQKEWYGWRPMTYDGLPIIDRLPILYNVTIAAGHNMIGMGAAPATGKLITAIISGEVSDIEIEPYSCKRF